jgi:hypothetical protein
MLWLKVFFDNRLWRFKRLKRDTTGFTIKLFKRTQICI